MAESCLFDLGKLVGRWESKDIESHQIEEWSQVGPDELRGKGFVLESGDTTFIEFLSIRKDNGVLTYFAQVSGLNNHETVAFRLSDQTLDRIEFSNPGHDFPKKIVYIIKPMNQMQAFIEGPRGGETIRVIFDFEKN